MIPSLKSEICKFVCFLLNPAKVVVLNSRPLYQIDVNPAPPIPLRLPPIAFTAIPSWNMIIFALTTVLTKVSLPNTLSAQKIILHSSALQFDRSGLPSLILTLFGKHLQKIKDLLAQTIIQTSKM